MRQTRHARTRQQQRGITAARLQLHLRYADRETPVGGGSTSLSLSRQAVHDMRGDGVSQQEIDRLRRLAIIQDGERIRTILHIQARRGRRYRRAVGS
ncbi:MAG TPA: hypothetical protein VED40_23410 [Azospirillaceae bacterium]|nr:hypothetical protein [Azospirillaceae bacterium]